MRTYFFPLSQQLSAVFGRETTNRGTNNAQSPRLFFLHIPKTAGTSFVVTAGRWFGENGSYVFIEGSAVRIEDIQQPYKRFISGHVFYRDMLRFPAIKQYRTAVVLREPYARLASHLKLMDSYNNPDRGDELANALQAIRPEISEQVRSVAQMVGSANLNDPNELAKLFACLPAWGRVAFDNCQTRFLACDPRSPSSSPYAGLTEEAVETALERLGKFDAVGISERLDGVFARLGSMLGFPTPAEIVNTNVGTSGRPVDYSNSAIREIMRPFVTHDLRLYERAVALSNV